MSQNSMNQRSLRAYKIDPRKEEDIEARIREIAASYAPEWQFSTEDPDIGSTIGRIYARQMQENIRAVNNVLNVYQIEFVNLLDLTLKRATPAGSVVVFTLVDSAVSGTEIPRGTRILAEEGGDEDVNQSPVFETDRSLYVTSSQITDIFSTDREEGCIVPLLGEFERPELFEGEFHRDSSELFDPEEAQAAHTLSPFLLFGERNSIGRHALLFYHPYVFDAEGETIEIRIQDGEALMAAIASGELTFSWLSEDGLIPFEDMRFKEDGNTILLTRHGECRKVNAEEENPETGESLVVLESAKPLTRSFYVSDIRLSSTGDRVSPEYVGNDDMELDPAEFAPFTNTLSTFAEAYIGMSDYFSKAGSRVTLDFHLTFKENALDVEREQAEENLKIIKRRARAVRETVVTDVHADEIALEYFNGLGWKRLTCETEITTLFAQEQPGQYSISFTCPTDWRVSVSGAYQGRLLRLRLLRTDNCYLRPALHHYPVIVGLQLSYTYRGREVNPTHLRSMNGTVLTDLTAKSREDEPYAVFMPISYADDALYLGFDEPITSGPVGLLFRLSGDSGQEHLKCRFEYSSRRGFRPIKIVDGTEEFSRSGIILFAPPSDFHAVTLEGKRRYWIRAVREEVEEDYEELRSLPHITDIRVNAMTVTNTITGEEEDYYIDEAAADMHFFLGSSHILDAEVWVNERAGMSGAQMRQFMEEHPERVRAEYDIVGNISAFYVLWNECEHFEHELGIREDEEWDSRRCYRIDRMTGELFFGDGVRTEIPRVLDDVAFRVRLRTSAGEAGNVDENILTVPQGQLMYVGDITNPIRAYGGSNMETVQQALQRGADTFYSRDRMVSMRDYERAILRYNGVIDKVRGIAGQTIDGRENPAELSFVLLMKDHADGAFSFHRIEARLRQYLLERSEITLAPARLHIVEPIFVRISVSVWTEVMRLD
ncbi:MAG: hypothetical protein IJT34_09435, partial [Butyrivibrio sp.]|nr:hypothetical protein [Butyrivibrio sp.]